MELIKKAIIISTLLVVMFVLGPEGVRAATGINKKITFQGKIVNKGVGDSDGTNVVDGNYDFVFTLYSTLAAGTSLWSETWNSGTTQVPVTSGVFTAAMGTYTTFPAGVDFNTDNIFLAVNFNGDGDMSPRVQFTAVPYAINAGQVAGLTVTDTTGTLTIPNGKTISFGDNFSTTGVGITLDQSLATTDSPTFAGLTLSTVSVGTGTTVIYIDSSGNLVQGTLPPGGVGTTNTYFSGSGLTLDIGNSFSLNLGSSNVWLALQTYNGGIGITGRLVIDGIGLGDTGASSGASIIGVYDELANSDSANVQDVLDDLDAKISSKAGYDRIVAADGTGTDATITLAISNASAGNVIFITAGTYPENITIDKPLTLIGVGSTATIINGSTGSPTITIASAVNDVTIANLKATNSGSASTDDVISSPDGTARYRHRYYQLEISGGDDGIYVEDTNDVIISQSYIHNTAGDAVNYKTSENVSVINNSIKNITGIGIYAYINNFRTIITGNNIYNTTDDSIQIYGATYSTVSSNIINTSGDYGIYSYQSDHSTITGNTIYNSTDHSIYTFGSNYVSIADNSIRDSAADGIAFANSDSNISITGNTIYSCTGDGIDLNTTIINFVTVSNNAITSNGAWGINLGSNLTDATITGNTFESNTSGSISTAAVTKNILLGLNNVQGNENVVTLTRYPYAGTTFSGDLLRLNLGGTDPNSFTGNGLHVVVDQSQTTGNLILAETDSAGELFKLDGLGNLNLGGTLTFTSVGVNIDAAAAQGLTFQGRASSSLTLPVAISFLTLPARLSSAPALAPLLSILLPVRFIQVRPGLQKLSDYRRNTPVPPYPPMARLILVAP